MKFTIVFIFLIFNCAFLLIESRRLNGGDWFDELPQKVQNSDENELGMAEKMDQMPSEENDDDELVYMKNQKHYARSPSRQRRSTLCNRVTGDRLCHMAPFKWRCECGVAGCYNGHCQCNQCWPQRPNY